MTIEPTRPRTILNDCIQLVRGLADKRKIEVVDLTNGYEMPLLLVDRTRFRQVLLNILSNAVKYNVEGGRVTIRSEVTSNDNFRISISDTGKGISDDQKKELFKPFSRLEMHGDIEGTGIGLTITKKLIELMSGRIGFSSEPGKGTTFWLEFVITSKDEMENLEDVSSVPDENVLAPQTPQIRTLLYIEDNPSNLKLMEEIVKCVPHLRFQSAHNAELGLEMAQIWQPDIIVMDINLPGMDGFDALDRIRRDEKLRRTPVIALSANVMPNDIKKGIESGFQAYMTKPINIAEFLAGVEKVLAGVS